jgi:transcriptional regulator with XRE-family HTH domain
MNTEEWFRNKLESFKKNFEFRLETLILDLTESVSKRMKEKCLTRTNLAELLKVSRPAVTKILSGNSNFTLKTLLSLADALELELKIDFKEKGIVTPQKISIPLTTNSAFFNRALGDGISATASTSITSPFPSREAEEGSLPRVVNA